MTTGTVVTVGDITIPIPMDMDIHIMVMVVAVETIITVGVAVIATILLIMAMALAVEVIIQTIIRIIIQATIMAQELQATPDHLREALFNHQGLHNQYWQVMPLQRIPIDQNLLI